MRDTVSCFDARCNRDSLTLFTHSLLTYIVKMNIISVNEGGFIVTNASVSVPQPRGARRRARTRADLLLAARQVFAARGFHEATIAEITTAADVAVGTFYLYFTDKQDVLAVLMREGVDALAAQVRDAVADVPIERLIPAGVHAIFTFAYAQRELFAIAFAGGQAFGAGKHARLDLADHLTMVFEIATERNLLDGYDVPLLARMVTGVIFQSIAWWFDHDEPGPEAMTAQVLRLLRYGLPPTLLGDTDLPSLDIPSHDHIT